MKNSNKFSILTAFGLLASIFLLSLASASINLYPDEISLENVTHGSSKSFTFVVENDYGHNLEDVTISLVGLDGFDVEISPDNFDNFENNTNKTVNVKVDVPKHKSSGTYNGGLEVGGFKFLPIELKVKSSPSLSISGNNFGLDSNKTTITVTNDGNEYLSGIEFNVSGDFGLEFNESLSFLNVGESKTIGLEKNVSRDSLSIGENKVEIVVFNDDADAKATLIAAKTFCEYGSSDEDLEIKRVLVSNLGQGSREEWLPLDTIEVEVEVESLSEERLERVVLELGLFKKGSNTNVADEMIWLSRDKEEIALGNMREGDERTHTFVFRIDPEVDYGSYTLVLKAYPEASEDEVCVDFTSDSRRGFSSSDFVDEFRNYEEYFGEVFIDRETDIGKMIVVDEESYSTIETNCSRKFTFSLDVYNIGDFEFEEKIRLTLSNEELNIDEEVIIMEGLKEGEMRRVHFSLETPSYVEKENYTLVLRIDSDYDEFDEEYRESSFFQIPLNIQGNCLPLAFVDLSLESDPMENEEFDLRVLLINNAYTQHDFTLEVDGYYEWAELVSINESRLTVESEGSGYSFVTLKAKENSAGEQSFVINVYSNDELIATQPVVLEVEEAKGFFSSIATGSVINEENWHLWGLGFLNLIVVIAIIVVAVRLMKKK